MVYDLPDCINMFSSCYVIIISGPTATGKSLAAEIISDFLDVVIINADSQQVYKEIPIITDQPNFSSINRMYGYVSVKNSYSLGFWIKDVVSNIIAAWEDNKVPIIVGGTYMYIDVLLNGISHIPDLKEEIYQKYLSLFNSLGLYSFKNKFLPYSKYNDKMRLCRSAALIEQTGKSLEEWHKNRKLILPSIDKTICCALFKDRSFIYKSIEERYKNSFDKGVVDEAKKIIDMKINKKVCGLSPIIKYIQNSICIDEAIEYGQMEIKKYAKRQITWFRNSACKRWNFFEEVKDLVCFIKLKLKDFNFQL